MLKPILAALILILSFGNVVAEFNNSWHFSENYPYALERAQQGDKHAQESVVHLIYQGVMRYPRDSHKNEAILFSWLQETSTAHSFERKVARLFFKGGQVDNAKELLKEIKERATAGDPYAQRILGGCYFYTKLVERDSYAGIKWYLKAAKQGHARAQMSLALRYLTGAHTKKNIAKGLKWLMMASDSGLPEAQATLSNYYCAGINLPQDIDKGYRLLLAAAQGGDTPAQLKLALYHLDYLNINFPTEKNIQEGMKWLTRAFNSADIEAIYIYGCLHAKGKYFKQDKKKGLSLIKRAAELGHKEAQHILSDLGLNPLHD